ncbi:hypothetical protein [Paenibacillus soyae]|uniref:Uncharacterized protein n=1 Tax=Paenibacillus soyae TaxID=2969249 RepID=A0A9X2S9J9_9BACL|nr:hypothetical protein [Paenibacillus soyae]MCR2805190.1 hypothetical protein [Paenibacillus soyae]
MLHLLLFLVGFMIAGYSGSPSIMAVEDSEAGARIEYINEPFDIRVSGRLSEQGDRISEFTIERNGRKAGPYAWEQSSLREPVIYDADIDQDGLGETVVVTIHDHGTGIVLSEAHVLDNQLEELKVRPVQEIINESVIFSGKKVYVGEKVLYEASQYGDLKPYYEDWIHYKVADGKLIGSVRIGDGRAEQYAGYLEVEYEEADGQYIAGRIRHVSDGDMDTEGTPLSVDVVRPGGGQQP